MQRRGDDRRGRRLRIELNIDLAGGFIAGAVAGQQAGAHRPGRQRAHVPGKVQGARRGTGEQFVADIKAQPVQAERRCGAAGDRQRPGDDLAIGQTEGLNRRAGGDQGDVDWQRRAGLAGEAAELHEHRLQPCPGGQQVVGAQGTRTVGVGLAGGEDVLPEHPGEEGVLAEAEGDGIGRGELQWQVAHAGAGEAAGDGETGGEHGLAGQRRTGVDRTGDAGGDVGRQAAAPPVALHVEHGTGDEFGVVQAVGAHDRAGDTDQSTVGGAHAAVIEGEEAAADLKLGVASRSQTLALVAHAEERAELRAATSHLQAATVAQPQMTEAGAGVDPTEQHTLPIALGRR